MSLTPILDILTDAVAGTKNVRDGQERASERLYAGLDRKMKKVKHTLPEMVERKSSASSQTSISGISQRVRSRPLSRTFSYDQDLGVASPFLSSGVELHRSQSERPIQTPAHGNQKSPLSHGTDVPGMTGQTKKAQTQNGLLVWDVEKLPFPAMPEMTGFSRYRVAVNADPEWKAEHFRKQVGDLGDMVSQLDMTGMTGMTNEDWQTITRPTFSRRDSMISSRSQASSRTTTSCDPAEQYTDPLTGTQVTRGFSPSSISSARSSIREGQLRSRKGSSLSLTTSARADSDSSSNRGSQTPGLAVSLERRASNPLSTIVEFLPADQFARKLHKPCEFSTVGDPESAVASDAEDDEEGVWSDVVEKEPKMVSAITEMIQRGQTSEGLPELRKTRTNSSERRRGRASLTAIQRSGTIRAVRPLIQRRRSSRSTALVQDKTTLIDTKETAKDERNPHCHVPVPQIDGSDHFSEPNDGGDLVEGYSTAVDKDQDRSALNNAESFPAAELAAKNIPRPQRHRSATAVFGQPNMSKK